MTIAAHPITFGKVKPRRKGLARLLTHHTFRRITQIGVFAFILGIALRHLLVGESGAIITASWEAYCPMGGLETLYKFITSGGKYVSHVHLSNLVILGATLLVALVARNAFCGWLCPFGFLQDMVSSFSAFVQKRVPGIRKAVKTLKTRGAKLAVLDRYLRFLKYAVLAWAVGGAAYFGTMVFREYDPYAALWNLLELSIGPGVAVLVVLLIASLFVERPWCRYACPLGAATGLVSKLSPFYLKREAEACKACAVCTTACPMGLPVHTATTIKSADCIGCLECVDVCPREGALELKIGVPVFGK
ncbi:MAG: 4Fe-4S binding protein [Chloroflexi bacterium]|nr:4Fe-4S binding protein [Chloroflexota bacterium]